MANVVLCNTLTHEKLKELGFKHESDGSGSPWGYEWNLINNKFHILIEPGYDVKLKRVDVDTDFIEITIDSVFDLEMLVAWVN